MSKRIFIADNRTHVVEMMEERLTKKGYDVISTCNGAEVIKTLGINNVPDVIVLDAGLEGVDPVKICHDIKSERRLRDVPLLLLKESKVEEKPFRELGVEEFLTRPCNQTDLMERIRLLATYGTSKAQEKKSGIPLKVIGLLLMLACFIALLLLIFIPGFTNSG